MGKKIDPTTINPLTGAITVGLSFFVGLMSLIVSVVAFATAGHQDNPNPDVFTYWNNEEAARLAVLTGIVALVNGVVAFAKARLRPWVTAGTTAIFFVTVFFANGLFGRAW